MEGVNGSIDGVRPNDGIPRDAHLQRRARREHWRTGEMVECWCEGDQPRSTGCSMLGMMGSTNINWSMMGSPLTTPGVEVLVSTW